MRPLLALVMIVKDEVASIARTLDSCDNAVDCFSILDTGSTDGTQEIIRAWRAVGQCIDLGGGVRQLGSGSVLREESFPQPIHFAAARNRALDIVEEIPLLSRPVFTLFLSGDETLSGGDCLREFLEARRSDPDGAYCIEMRSEILRWIYPRVLRTGAGWRYVGANQEVPVGPNGETTGPVIPKAVVTHEVTDHERRKQRVREVDLPVLTRMVEDESKTLASRAQAIFHLGEVHAGLAAEDKTEARLSRQMAAMGYFERYARIAEKSDPAKANYARLLALNIAESTGLYDTNEILRRYIRLPRDWPECAYKVAAFSALGGDAHAGLNRALEAAEIAHAARWRPPSHVPTDTRLEWLSLRLAADCARALGAVERARELAERGIAAGGPREAFAEHFA